MLTHNYYFVGVVSLKLHADIRLRLLQAMFESQKKFINEFNINIEKPRIQIPLEIRVCSARHTEDVQKAHTMQ